MICEWRKDGVKFACVRCGSTRKTKVNRNCRNPCPHLGPEIQRNGVTIKVKCGCSQKEYDQPHASHKCELHKRCLPTLFPADPAKWLEREEAASYMACSLCPDNPATKAKQAAVK